MTITKQKTSAEQKLDAHAVSRGVAIGKIVCLHGKKRQFYRYTLKKSQIEKELRRFRAAVRLSKRQLKKLSQRKTRSSGETQANIFEAHLMILEDVSLLAKIETTIQEKKVNAEWAVKTVTDRYLEIYKDIQDEYLRERRIDLQDISERILSSLGGGEKQLHLEKGAIIVANELKPSTLVELGESELQGIVTESGGWTSHTFILAREMGIPAVTGIKGILRRVKAGEQAIVDGFQGQFFVNPMAATVTKYQREAEKFDFKQTIKDNIFKDKLKTLDGRAITIRANLEVAEGYAKAQSFGAEGVGLFRSEFLINQNQSLPTEKQQINAYRRIGEMTGEAGAKIRTFDINLESLNDEAALQEKNPALGMRAIRLSLSHEKIFRSQLRAILQASYETNLDILLPMISDISEILDTKNILQQEKIKLEKNKKRCGNPRIGAMIEVPSAVLMIDEIVQEVDFICVGTNDLVQYLLGVDRDNELVADWFRTLNPAVLRSLKKIVKAAEERSIPAIICGEMAGSHVYAAILLGLGVTELSMHVNAMPRIRQVISHIAYEEAREIVSSLENCRTAGETEALLRDRLLTKWAHLYPASILPPAKKKKLSLPN